MQVSSVPKSINPIIMAFNNCRWKLMGKKVDPDTRKPSLVCFKKWQIAGDAYHRFDRNMSGLVYWASLKATAESTNPEERVTTCVSCIPNIKVPESDCEQLPCGDFIHKTCLQKNEYRPPSCLTCISQRNMTAFQRREAGLTKSLP